MVLIRFRQLFSGLLTIVVIASLVMTAAEAGPSERRGGYQNLDNAVANIRKRTGGRVLSAETREQEEGPVHHIRIITDEGRVKRYRLDARSGRMLAPPGRR
jgi:uncharacterized membrane protein YkoI